MLKSMEPIFALRLALPERSSRGLLRAVHAQLRTAIQDGRLKPGLQLPPSRVLARTLGISRNTALAAYDRLLGEGYLTARRGAGTYVSDARPVLRRRAPRSRASRASELNAFWRTPPRLFGNDPNQYRYNFAIGTPDTTQFPFVAWRRLVVRAARALSREQPLGADPAGREALRTAIATHVSFARAIACEPTDVIVTAGAQQAFDLLARVLVTPGRTTAAIEAAHYPPLRQAFSAAGAKLVRVPCDDDGIRVERISPRARIICVTPSHQFPLGSPMSLARRVALLEFAAAHGANIIEDDYDGEYRFGGRPLDALQTLDRDERVFYVGTFSKSLFPALRLGYIVAPAWARAALIAAKQIADRHCALLTQDTLAQFIAEGHLTRHVRKMTRIYGARRAVLLDALHRHCGGMLTPIPAEVGLHITARLNLPVPAADIMSRAASASVKVQTVAQFSDGAVAVNGLGFGYGGIETDEVDAGVRALAKAIVVASRATRRDTK
jgi:GntR family transcriptional regulator/MocR family aminotransferase